MKRQFQCENLTIGSLHKKLMAAQNDLIPNVLPEDMDGEKFIKTLSQIEFLKIYKKGGQVKNSH